MCNLGDSGAGKCVAEGSGCVITGPTVECGAQKCGPGSTCSPKGECLAELPCQTLVCEGGSCWGQDCPCARPPAPCEAAPTGKPGEKGTLNDPEFLGAGLSDLDFDDQCGAWASSFVSGPDSLRHIDAKGVVAPPVLGVTNLNMGEVALRLSKEDVNIAITYNCCATCGCVLSGSGGNPQGAALLDTSTKPPSLPMKIPTAKFSSGPGPFGDKGLDTGPMGLSWGADFVLYLGNVEQNGDFVALDLSDVNAKNTVVATFEKRVHAAAPFDAHRLLVATEGGSLFLVPTLGIAAPPQALVTLPDSVTSLHRDRWSGRIYAALSNRDIVSFKADGTDLTTFQTTDKLGRIALGPDGYLYHLTMYPSADVIVRFPLPSSLLRPQG